MNPTEPAPQTPPVVEPPQPTSSGPASPFPLSPDVQASPAPVAPAPAEPIPSSPSPAAPAQPMVSVADNVADSDAPLIWEASEFVHHEKDIRWFLLLLLGGAIFTLIAIFLVRSWTFAALVVVMMISIVVLARRSPRTVRYQLSAQGIQIDDKHFSYHDFRAFDVVSDGGLDTIVLIPVKRFMPSTTLFFPPEHGEAIVDTLGSAIPMERITPDFIDRLSRYLRF